MHQGELHGVGLQIIDRTSRSGFKVELPTASQAAVNRLQKGKGEKESNALNPTAALGSKGATKLGTFSPSKVTKGRPRLSPHQNSAPLGNGKRGDTEKKAVVSSDFQ